MRSLSMSGLYELTDGGTGPSGRPKYHWKDKLMKPVSHMWVVPPPGGSAII
jgi:hypothetical protein